MSIRRFAQVRHLSFNRQLFHTQTLLLLLLLTWANFPIAVNGQNAIEIDPRIWRIYQDRSGSYWFGSNGSGVYRYHQQTLTQYTEREGLRGTQVRDIEEDAAGNVYIATEGGISRFDGEMFQTLEMVKPTTEDQGWKLNRDDVWLVDPRPGLYGTCRYDGETLHRLQLPPAPEGKAPSGVYSIFRDRAGHLWFGTPESGVCRYDGNHFHWLFEKPLTTTPQGGEFGIRSVYQDRAGDFWISNTRQRFQISPKSGLELKNHRLDYTKKEGLPNSQEDTDENFSYFHAVTEDSAGSLWMACGSNGVWKYDGQRVTHYSLGDGAYALTLLYDREGTLWVGTLQHGIHTFDGEKFERFSPTR